MFITFSFKWFCVIQPKSSEALTKLVAPTQTPMISDIFSLLPPERCLLACRSTYYAFFMDLPVCTMTAISVDLVVAHDGLTL